MKISKNYKIREIAGETIVVNQGTANVNMTRIISLNQTAKFLYEQLQDKEFELEDAAQLLVDTFGITKEVAMKDVAVWADSLRKCGIVE